MSRQGGPILADNHFEIFNPDEIGIDNLRTRRKRLRCALICVQNGVSYTINLEGRLNHFFISFSGIVY